MKNDDLLFQDAPLVLLATRDRSLSAQLCEVLQARSWRVGIATNAEEARRIAAAEPIAMLIIDGSEPQDDTNPLACALRDSSGPSQAAPILALASSNEHQTDPKPTSVDGMLPPLDSGMKLVRALERWQPVSLEPTRRIVAMFGSGPIAGMMERLALRLEAALASLDRNKIDTAEAHRLAGLCGTLGFAQAHAAWLDISLGDSTALDEARRTTRLTLAAIARGL
ncbi:hypothetical protein [Novosphingobium sp. 9U]|uniref:hypothetical protein n=1 Tax=Novosphingobium sp. 9U TaxID=2653158 RepID=UPI0012F16F26|nr:hypothetical protein [Novosphingobium sp. 9U]VWX46926.1 putative Response regulator receiver domain-containing protein [Novosphingobium sp. 9U]